MTPVPPPSRPAHRPRACQRHDLCEVDPAHDGEAAVPSAPPKLPAPTKVPHRHARGPRQRRRDPDRHPRQVRVARILRSVAFAPCHERNSSTGTPPPRSPDITACSCPASRRRTRSRAFHRAAPRVEGSSGRPGRPRRVDVKTGCTWPGPRLCGSHARVASGRHRPISRLHASASAVVDRSPSLRDVARPGRQRLGLDSAAEPSAVTMRPRMGALPLVPGKLLRARRRDRRQHTARRSLQRLEQHSPPVPRPSDHRRPHRSASCTTDQPALAPTPLPRPPAPGGITSPWTSIACTNRRRPCEFHTHGPRCERGSSSEPAKSSSSSSPAYAPRTSDRPSRSAGVPSSPPQCGTANRTFVLPFPSTDCASRRYGRAP